MKMKLLLVTIGITAFSTACNVAAPPAAAVAPPDNLDLHILFAAIRQAETGGVISPANAVGDAGKSIGPYQIQRAYWLDSGIPGRWGYVRDCRYAENVMMAYWRRYCPDSLAVRDFEVLARIHNGGPHGHKRTSTSAYWSKVKKFCDL